MSIVLDHARARKIIRDGYEIGPRLHPCSCGAPRHLHSGSKNTGGHEPRGCRRYRRDNADALAEWAMEHYRSNPLEDVATWHARAYPRPTPTAGGWGIGPSDIGSCRRRIQLRERPPADIFYNIVDPTAAVLGDIFHEVISRARRDLYGPHKGRKYEFAVTVPGLDRTGRVDEYDLLNAIATDYKSAGEYAWEDLGIDGPQEGHWKQLAIYGYALACSGRDVDVLRLIYIRRSNGDVEQFERPYDEAFAKAALSELTAIALALDLGQELPRDGRGPSSDPICARFCPVRDYCWSTAAAAAAGRTPESWTLLGEHPDIADIEWAAEQARDWKDNEKEAAREYKAAVPLLGGIPDGTYGIYQVKERTRRMPEYKAYFEAVRRASDEYLLTPEDARGDFHDVLARIPLPYRRDVWPEVKLVRAADRPDEGATP